MTAHPLAAVSAVRSMAMGRGGKSLVVSLPTASQPAYAGVHRLPAATLLEAILTFVGREYPEIILAAGRGPHLPLARISPVLSLGTGRAIVSLKRVGNEPQKPVADRKAPVERFMVDDAKRRSARSASHVIPVELDASNRIWKDRAAELLKRLEGWCGVDDHGQRLETSDRERRRLVLLDVEYLLPDPKSWRAEIEMSPAEAGRWPRRLSRIPEICVGTGTDIILLTRDAEEARAVNAGDLLYRKLNDGASQYEQLTMKWGNTAIATWPAGLSESFCAYYSQAPIAVPAYEVLRTKAPKRRPTAIQRPPASISEALARLERFIGMAEVKDAVRGLVSEAAMEQRRAVLGVGRRGKQASRHMVFYGNPGTGKTEVARLMGAIFHHLGLLSRGHLVEAKRPDLIGEHVGETAIKVQNKVTSAIGGVLFIDEAYSLRPQDGSNDYGREAIDTLLAEMENNRKDLVVIVAGYAKRMQDFLESNQGLKSRFPKYVEFPDYQPVDLLAIFRVFCEDEEYSIGAGVEEMARAMFEQAWAKRDENFGNARMVRNVFEGVIARQARRLEESPALDVATIMTIEASDLDGVSAFPKL